MPNDDNFHLEYNLAALVAHQVTFNRLLRGESNLRPPWYTSVKKKLGIRRVKLENKQKIITGKQTGTICSLNVTFLANLTRDTSFRKLAGL